MNKTVMTTLGNRVVVLAASSVAVVLGGCGGGATATGQSPAGAPPVTAASVVALAGPGAAMDNFAVSGYSPDDVRAGDSAGEQYTGQNGAGSSALKGPQNSALQMAAAWRDGTLEADGTIAPQATSGAASLYVSLEGKDSNPGTADQPMRTIARAAQAAKPGTTVYVAPGVYSGGFQTTADGAANARISFVSTRRWGAVLVPPEDSGSDMAWDNRGDYVDIVGFTIDGRAYRGGKRWTHGIYNAGSHDTIRRNHVHHIAQDAPCTSAGGSAIGVDGYYRGVQSHVLANLVHDIGPAGCRYVQGIYISTTGSVKNNVVHRVSEGAIHLWHDARDVVITNNTVTRSNTGIIVGGGDYYHSSGPNDHTSVYNNIVYGNKMGISEQGETGPNNSYRNNLVYGNATYDFKLNNGLTHSDTVQQDPRFVNDIGDNTFKSPDLSLRRGSPAIGRATPALTEGADFNGRPRNARSGYDIGAYQHF